MPTPDAAIAARRQRIIAGLQGRGLEQAVADPALWNDLEAEANSDDPDKLVTPDLLLVVRQARMVRLREPTLGLFFNTDDVILVPGFLGSQLVDAGGGNGLIWIDPTLVFSSGQLLALGLGAYQPGVKDTDATPKVTIRPQGALPVLYDGLRLDLEVRRYGVQVFGFDWRKSAQEAAEDLAAVIRDRAGRRFRPLHLIAHSQGSMVARRALQLVGPDLARRLVNNLVLLGPATAGTFAAAFALAGNPSLLETLRRFHIQVPEGFTPVLQSMTGLYELLPWRTDPVDHRPPDPVLDWVRQHHAEIASAGFWQTGIDPGRLTALYGWGRTIDASFLNDRTTIILGDQPTVGGVKFAGGQLVEDPDFRTDGDGTVPDALARLEGVTRVYRARGAEHAMLPATWAVIVAVRDVLAGRPPQIEALGIAGADVPFLASPRAEVPPGAVPTAAAPDAAPVTPPALARPGAWAADVSPPQHRRLRVYSYDPLFATDLDALGVEQITVEIPWEYADGDLLQPGPVGEYLEVVDYDPSNECFYPPVDLNHPHLLAQDGMPPSEGDPRFHQQMAYAVAMNTIREFEIALGRTVLWAPRLIRDPHGEVRRDIRPADEYVQRLRIYPHALRQANAFYHPGKKALLFGYFPAQGADVGRNLPGGMIFTCLSHDVVAHETTHGLLDGLHRYFTEPSNPDVYAFHEAFADVVALFQHFSHPEVLWYQLARTRGDLRRESMLGVLAAQFGEAIGRRGALRQYLGQRTAKGEWEPVEPDPTAVTRVWEPHDRGALLVAALFRAFANIYENRVQDLRRIATNGTGVLPQGNLHPDLVTRLAGEAAKAARNMLTMCVRALDYVPPVDITFGEYLRAVITADYDLVKDDDRRYRVAIVAAFRDWGIYPEDVRSLSVDSLLWSPPPPGALRHLNDFLRDTRFDGWDLHRDRHRAYDESRRIGGQFHDWLRDRVADGRDASLGLALGPDAPKGIRRGADGRPVFEVHSFRPCRRIGPDGQQQTDLVVEIVQRRKAFFDEDRQKAVDDGTVAFDQAAQDFWFRGGCTLIIDPETGDIRYCIRKSVGPQGDDRLARERQSRQGQLGDKVGGVYLTGEQDEANPFAFLHSGH
jgi:hypothetical protein